MPPQPPAARFPSGPPSLPPSYAHQYSSHTSQGHGANHQQQALATPAYMAGSPMGGGFAGANGLGALGGLNAGTAAFGVADQTGLNSHAARMGFAHGGPVPQQQHLHQQSHGMGDHVGRQGGAAKGRIRDVWKHNLQEEMSILRELIDDYPYVAMDTEFPGIVGRPMGSFIDKSDYHYQTLRVNVDMLKIIQVGLAVFNEKGETPPARPQGLADASDSLSPTVRKYINAHGTLPYAWQFNFHFDIKADMANQSSIESLQQAGIDFDKLERDGIDPRIFASLMTSSGLVGFEDKKWLSFHGGYDFGYFTKCLMDKELPNDGARFETLMKIWFPTTYDVKHLLKYAIKLHSSGRLTPTDPSATDILQKFEQKSGLEATAESFKVKRVGAAHQAGSDSLLTGKIFFALRERIFNGNIPDEHIGKTWGLAVGGTMSFAPAYPPTAPNGQENTPQGGTNANVNGNGPTTPSTSSVGLVTTPAAPQSHNTNGNGPGYPGVSMTPGGGMGGGQFGSFTYSNNSSRV